jgi:hypothetical protein
MHFPPFFSSFMSLSVTTFMQGCYTLPTNNRSTQPRLHARKIAMQAVTRHWLEQAATQRAISVIWIMSDSPNGWPNFSPDSNSVSGYMLRPLSRQPSGSLYRSSWNKRKSTFIHLAVFLTTGPKPLPKRDLHIVLSRASSFKWEYPLLSWRSFSSFLRLLPRLPVTSIPLLSFLQ